MCYYCENFNGFIKDNMYGICSIDSIEDEKGAMYYRHVPKDFCCVCWKKFS